MFERLDTAEEAYHYKLGAALKMENTVLEMLGKNAEEAQDDSLKELFHHHEEETKEHIENLRAAFIALGWEVDDSPSPAIEGIDKEGKANAKKADDSVVDSVLLQSAVETEHHEIAVYENLIVKARAMGADDVVALLQHNLEQEQHTLEEAQRLLEQETAGRR